MQQLLTFQCGKTDQPLSFLFNGKLRPSQEMGQAGWLARWEGGCSVLNATPNQVGLGDHPKLGAELYVQRSAHKALAYSTERSRAGVFPLLL